MTTVSIIDHTADIGIRVTACSAAEAFVGAAEGMFDIMMNRAGIEAREEWPVEVEASGWDDLLVAWLEELLYLYETEGRVPRAIALSDLTPTHLRAALRGQRLDPDVHETGVQIKAVTYHQLRVEETETGFEIAVIFDI